MVLRGTFSTDLKESSEQHMFICVNYVTFQLAGVLRIADFNHCYLVTTGGEREVIYLTAYQINRRHHECHSKQTGEIMNVIPNKQEKS